MKAARPQKGYWITSKCDLSLKSGKNGVLRRFFLIAAPGKIILDLTVTIQSPNGSSSDVR